MSETVTAVMDLAFIRIEVVYHPSRKLHVVSHLYRGVPRRWCRRVDTQVMKTGVSDAVICIDDIVKLTLSRLSWPRGDKYLRVRQHWIQSGSEHIGACFWHLSSGYHESTRMTLDFAVAMDEVSNARS